MHRAFYLAIISFAVFEALMVVIIGAGVSGLVTAVTLARRGVPVTLLEEHESVGVPCHCGGVVSADYCEKIGIPLPSSLELNRLYGFKFTDGTREIVVRSSRAVAKVISRRMLDMHLAELCEAHGVDLLTSKRALSVATPDEPTVVDDSGGNHRPKYVVLASGISDNLGQQVGMIRDESSLLVSAQCVAKKRMDPAIATIYMSSQISPDFFGYVVPIDEGRCRIGVASRKADVMRSLHAIARKEGAELSKKPMMWGIWTGGPLSKTRQGNVIAVGDAAGMSKATTGGGIVFGALSGRAAAETIIAELKGERPVSSQSLQDIRRHLYGIRRIRRLMNLVGPDLTMDVIITATTKERLARYMEVVDFDFHGSLIDASRAIRPGPSLLPLGAKALVHVVKGLFK